MIADVRKHLDKAKSNFAEEKAAKKWDEVLDYIRLHYHPDLRVNSGPQISQRTRQAINAAGGFQHLSDCSSESLQWARKRFIESYVRWEELQKERFLLAGTLKKLVPEPIRERGSSVGLSFGI
jgi:hypothetical protein